MKVLLLGATGLLGHNVLRALQQRGHEPVLLVRHKNALRTEAGGSRLIEGSLLDEATLLQAANGCEAVINCAGTTDMSLLHYDDYLPVNRDLCRMLIQVTDQLGIKVLVHVSTVNTIGYGTAEMPADESVPMRPPFLGSYYADSKKEGEQLILEAARSRTEAHLIVLNPGFMIGAYVAKPSSGRLLLAGYRKPLMPTPNGGKSFVHVQDVAEAAVNALTMGRNGERYIVVNSSASMSIGDFYRLQAQTMNYRQHTMALPDGMVRVAGWLGDALRALHIKTQLSTRNVRQLLVHEHYDNGKARRELQLHETPIATAVNDFFEWYKTNKI